MTNRSVPASPLAAIRRQVRLLYGNDDADRRLEAVVRHKGWPIRFRKHHPNGPYVLDGQYWAASWSGTLSVPRAGVYGLFAAGFPGTMEFCLQIAFSTTPIDASVFDASTSGVPEPATWLMLLPPLAVFIGWRVAGRG
ncbi:MAG: hypothetical protein EXQ52_04200 [Bryobacterales bacterium]|nr:hypothetical protein [Bryobacterales bacterium]